MKSGDDELKHFYFQKCITVWKIHGGKAQITQQCH